jgi:benzylsuccinate CoA-transferase BbsF subunit
VKGPLDGIRVLDFGIVWAGPQATRLLGDQGADVIKVESARRMDLIRGPVAPLSGTAGCYPDQEAGERPWNRHGYFIERNRNKRSVCLDLTMPEGRELALRLAAKCDLVLDNFKAGTMDRLGLGARRIHAVNPGAVVVSMSAYGASGPWRSYSGYGATIDALSGAVAATGYPGDGQSQNLGINSSDPVAGQHAYGAVLAALVARKRDGKGRFIDLSQLESAVRLMGVGLLEEQAGLPTNHLGNGEQGYAYSAVLRCEGEEQWLAVSCRDEAEVAVLLDVVGVEGLDGMEAALTQRDRDFVAMALQERGVAAAPVYAADEALEDEQLRDRDFYVELDHAEVGRRRYLGTPVRWQGRAREFEYRPAPLLGEHTDEVLREVLGLGDQELQELRERGVTADDPRAHV